jgi:flagellar biosynthetic protein FliR
MELFWELFDKFIFILARISGFIFTAPIFGSIIIPTGIRAAVALVLAALFTPLLAEYLPPLPPLSIEFAFIILGELLVGVFLGFIPFLFILTFQTSGALYSIPMGFGITTAIDPMAQIEQPLISQFLGLLGLLLFLSLDFHHILLSVIFKSYEAIPPFGLKLEALSFTTHQLINTLSFTFSSALKIAMPILGVLFLVNLALGLLSKAAPLLNILILGWPFTIFVGLLTLTILLPLIFSAGTNLMEKLNETLHLILLKLK